MSPTTPGYEAALTRAALFDLSPRTKITLQGKDARFFLHNLSTADVKDLPPGEGREAFLTNNKARLIAHVHVGHVALPDGHVLLLDSSPGLQKRVFEHLNHYLISEEVELADRTDEWALFRLSGPQAGALLSAANLPAAEKTLAYQAGPEQTVVRTLHDLGLPTFDVFCPASQAQKWHSILTTAGAVADDADTLETLRVEAGWPAWGKELDENRFVPEVGRTAQAVSFTKGCYLGQESIVMSRDRGHLNRLLLGLQVEGRDPVAPHSRVFQGEKEVGQVTSSVYSPRLGEVIALAYLQRGSWEAGTAVTVGSPPASRGARVTSLPFVGTSI